MDREIMKRLDQITEKINRFEVTFQKEMESQHNKLKIMDQKISTIITKIEQIDLLQTSITSVGSNLACVQENMEEVVRKVDIMETSLNITLKHGQDEVKKSLEDFRTETTTYRASLNDNIKDSLNNLETSMVAEVSAVKDVVVETRSFVETCYVNKKLKDNLESVTQNITTKYNESTNNIKDYIDRTKHEIFAMTEKEAQIVRDRIEGPLPSHGKYTFYFYLLNFKSLVRSGKRVFSLPWYINEFKFSVRGCVNLTTGGDMAVYLLYGRHPLSVGLQPATNDKKIKAKATICDIYKKILPDLEVGENTLRLDETLISDHIHRGCGWLMGSTSCDDLLQKGYGDQEGYLDGAVLIRYDLTVL